MLFVCDRKITINAQKGKKATKWRPSPGATHRAFPTPNREDALDTTLFVFLLILFLTPLSSSLLHRAPVDCLDVERKKR